MYPYIAVNLDTQNKKQLSGSESCFTIINKRLFLNNKHFFSFFQKSIDKELMFAYNKNIKRNNVRKGEMDMKIVNKKKFIRSTSITVCLIIFLILMLANISFSHTEVNYKEISVSSGDTLWNIANYEKNNNDYFENKDIRDIVAEIKYLNNLNTSNLNIGDMLIVPTI